MRGSRKGPARRAARAGAAAAAAALVLLLGACGSGDGGEGGGADDGGQADSAADGDGGSGSGGDGADAGAGGNGSGSGSAGPDLAPYQGPWSTGMEDGGAQMLILTVRGADVVLSGPEVACQGKLKAAGKPAELDLTCRDDGDPHTEGTVEKVTGKELAVDWAAGETTRFTKGAELTAPPE